MTQYLIGFLVACGAVIGGMLLAHAERRGWIQIHRRRMAEF